MRLNSTSASSLFDKKGGLDRVQCWWIYKIFRIHTLKYSYSFMEYNFCCHRDCLWCRWSLGWNRLYEVSNFFNSTSSSFNKKIDSGMKKVLEKLKYLASQKCTLGFKEGTYSSVWVIHCSNRIVRIQQAKTGKGLVTLENLVFGNKMNHK